MVVAVVVHGIEPEIVDIVEILELDWDMVLDMFQN